jgi:phosphohistidine phosphatase SixA
VAWVPVRKARKQLSYTFDQRTLEEALSTEWRTRALVVLRHTKARARKSWRKDDRLRPLLAEGKRDAARLIPLLSAYGPSRLVTSSSVRCAQTLAPYAEACGWPLQETDTLSEEDATAEAVVDIVDELLHSKESAAICTHRPVLPAVLDALGVVTDKLAPGELVVVHHRKGKVAAFERY